MNVLQFPFITPYSFTVSFFDKGCNTPLQQWFLYEKIAENPVVTPTTTVQVIKPSAVNRYLESVTVEAVTTLTA